MLTVLILARRQFGSSVNTFVANQAAMDLFTTAWSVVIYSVYLTHGLVYGGNHIVDNIICIVVESATISFGITAGKIGLMVITLERYFKIVHAVAHRKYYRNWMTKVGVALPWIVGACLVIFPAVGTTRVVNGFCQRTAIWPNKAMAKVRNSRSFIKLNQL